MRPVDARIDREGISINSGMEPKDLAGTGFLKAADSWVGSMVAHYWYFARYRRVGVWDGGLLCLRNRPLWLPNLSK